MTEKTYHDVFSFSIVAAAALTKHRFIGFNGNHCGAGKKALGVSLFNVGSGEMASLVCEGIALVEAAGAITLNADGTAPIKSDANGKAEKAVPMDGVVDSGAVAVTSSAANGNILTLNGSEAPEVINGYAMDAASGAGVIIRVKLV